MNRLFFLLLFTTVLLVNLASIPSLYGQANNRPNIVYILSDDMGFSDIGCYGSEIETPVLDHLANDGLRFTQFYNTARCCPTRASLLSGLYPHQAGVGHMMQDRGFDGYRGELNRNCVTIAEALKSAGYRSYMAGKWHVTSKTNPRDATAKDNWPRQRGFDRFYGTIHGAGSFFDPNTLTRDNEFISPFADPEYPKSEWPGGTYYYTDAIADHASRFIQEHHAETSDKPFFLYVAFTAAHWPMHALEADIAKYKGAYDGGYEAIRNSRYERMVSLGLINPDSTLNFPLQDAWKETEHWDWDKRNMEVYAAMIDCMDRGIGRIVDSLKETGQYENTLICFLQDNGGCAEDYGRGGLGSERAENPTLPALADDFLQPDMAPKQSRDGYPLRRGKGTMAGGADTAIGYGRGWATVSNTPFREYKHWTHEGGISTPLIAHWPSQMKRSGELETTPGHLIDLMATAVDVAGAVYPKQYHNGQPIKPMEGKSLRPLFAGESIDRDAIFWEHEGNRAVRVGDYKLVAMGADGPWELYNIAKDRSEQNDLSSEMPDKVEAMAKRWQAYAERADVLPLNPDREMQSMNVKQRRFELTAGNDLDRHRAPFVAKRGFTLVAEVDVQGDGVIVAQGGSTLGWAMYIQNDKLQFAISNQGKRTVYDSNYKIVGKNTITATLSKKGQLKMSVAEQPIGRFKFDKVVQSQPLDGLQVGRDEQGNVGDYESPFPLDGSVTSVIIEMQD